MNKFCHHHRHHHSYYGNHSHDNNHSLVLLHHPPIVLKVEGVRAEPIGPLLSDSSLNLIFCDGERGNAIKVRETMENLDGMTVVNLRVPCMQRPS